MFWLPATIGNCGWAFPSRRIGWFDRAASLPDRSGYQASMARDAARQANGKATGRFIMASHCFGSWRLVPGQTAKRLAVARQRTRWRRAGKSARTPRLVRRRLPARRSLVRRLETTAGMQEPGQRRSRCRDGQPEGQAKAHPHPPAGPLPATRRAPCGDPSSGFGGGSQAKGKSRGEAIRFAPFSSAGIHRTSRIPTRIRP
jgi:hypothetical protein